MGASIQQLWGKVAAPFAAINRSFHKVERDITWILSRWPWLSTRPIAIVCDIHVVSRRQLLKHKIVLVRFAHEQLMPGDYTWQGAEECSTSTTQTTSFHQPHKLPPWSERTSTIASIALTIYRRLVLEMPYMQACMALMIIKWWSCFKT